jgi:predicted Zn-dependent peptidase
VLAAFRAPALAEDDFAAMVLFDALVAGGKGFRFTRDYPEDASAPLHRAVAAVSAEAAADTQWQAARDPYVYTLAADVPDAGGLAAAEQALFGVIADAAAREWTAEEMARARRQVLTGWASDLDDKAGRAHQLAFFEVAGGHAHLLEMPGRLARVSPDDVRRFARERLARDRATVGSFVPTPAGPAPARAATTAVGPRPAVSPTDAGVRPTVAAAAEPVVVRLAHGLTVILAPVSGTLVSLRGRIEAGSVFDGATPGLSALATELLARPVPGAPPAIAPLAWTLHEDPDAAVTQRWIELSASCLPDDVPDLLRDVAARLSRALAFGEGGALAPGEWQTIQRAAAHRARTNEQVTATALRQLALAEMHADGPLRSPAWGRAGAIEAAGVETLRAFLRRHARPDAVRLALAGAIAVPALRAEVARRFGALAAGPGAAVALPRLSAARGGGAWREVRLPRPGKSQDDVRVVLPGERVRPWDPAATELLLYLLGETGYAGRLGHALVDPGLVYSVYATREEAPGLPGFLMIRTASAPRDTPEVLRRVRALVEDAARGAFTAAELREAQAYVRGKRARSREGSAAAAADALEAAPRRVGPAPDAVTLDQLNDTARRLFRGGAPVALVAGPPAD